jgi:prephenate dehydrogenase
MAQPIHFERIAIIGLGLLGGSVALAARRAGIAGAICASGRTQAPLDDALARGVVDAVGPISETVAGADLVVLGTPVSAMPAAVEAASPHLASGALITDVGSVKGFLAERLPGLLPPYAEYVGAHPMAGSHEKGVLHAREDLFDGACCVITPLPENKPESVARVRAFWEALGPRIVERDVESHDEEVAWVSHLPHVLAFAFAKSLDKSPITAAELAASGFRDFTRIARSNEELWGDIFSANRKALAGPLTAFGDALKKLALAIEQADTKAQEKILTEARERLALVAGVEPPENSG